MNGFCSALKQIGDVESWAQSIHKDVSVVSSTLEHAYTTNYLRARAAASNRPVSALPSITAADSVESQNSVLESNVKEQDTEHEKP